MNTSTLVRLAASWLLVLAMVSVSAGLAAQDDETEEQPTESPAPAAEIEDTSDAVVVEETASQTAEMEVTAEPTLDADRVFLLHVQPSFTPDQAEQVYRPLIDFLNANTPHQFDLQTSRDFHRYWMDIRRGTQPDLVLEDAHLVAHRMQRNGYRPLVKAEQPGSYSLMVMPGLGVESINDLVGLVISSMPAPSLGYLVLSEWFSNPMQQPRIQSSASSWLDAVEIVFSMEAEAAIVPHNLVSRYPNLDVLITSDTFPHNIIAASPDVPMSVQQDLVDALVTLQDDPEFFSALHEMDIDAFIPADPIEFEGMERWLRQIFSL
ncbi:MAG: phosphate/phosphite/phosphonate ABC transporter substrate-binding protein [Wenzhouxiangella sp.]